MTQDQDKKTQALHAMRLLDQNQLRALNRRLDWCNVDAVGIDNESRRKRIRNQAETALSDDSGANWDAFLNYIRDELIDGRHESTSDRIERVLQETNIMPLDESAINSDKDDPEWRKQELWYSSQLYGALRNEFSSQKTNPHSKLPLSRHLVCREHEDWGLAIDLYVRNERQDEPYLIEVKRAASINSIETVANQLYRYNTIFENREHTYLLVIYDPEEDESTHQFSEIESEVNKTVDKTTSIRTEITTTDPVL